MSSGERRWIDSARQAAREWEAARASAPAEASPSVGDVLVLPGSAHPVQWVVAREEGTERRRWLLVPADLSPLAGSGDVAVGTAGQGALTLRCRHALWWTAGSFEPLLGAGRLPLADVERVGRRWQAVASGVAPGSFTERETDESSAYEDWIEEVVAPARAELALELERREGARLLPFTSKTPPVAEPRPGPGLHSPDLPGRHRRSFLGLAAAALLLAAGGAGFFLWRQAGEIRTLQAERDRQAEAHRGEIAALERERAAIETSLRAQLEAAGQERARVEAELRGRLAAVDRELAVLRRATEVRNPLVAYLDLGSAQRGSTETLSVGKWVTHLVVVLPVDDPAGTRFRIEVAEKPSGRSVLVVDDLAADVRGEVSAGLPLSLLPPGRYRLRLSRLEGGAAHLVREHGLEIQAEPERRPVRW